MRSRIRNSVALLAFLILGLSGCADELTSDGTRTLPQEDPISRAIRACAERITEIGAGVPAGEFKLVSQTADTWTVSGDYANDRTRFTCHVSVDEAAPGSLTVQVT